MPLLEMRDICKSFSGVYANENVSFSADKGEIHALLGENGAGKTTLMNILFGLYQADSGEILWKGKPANFASPREAIEAGIGMVQQHFSLVRNLTVLDNMILNYSGNRFILDRKKERQKLLTLSERYGLEVHPDARIADLSVGERQRVEILKTLYREIELLILDEPTGVLTPQETSQFFRMLKDLKNEGYAIIIITHRMSEILEISDRVTVLRDGKKVAEHLTAETNADQLAHDMIGRDLHGLTYTEFGEADSAQTAGESAEKHVGKKLPVLELKSISRRAGKHTHALRDISLCVHAGEILGIAGVEGHGQKELAEVITGLKQATSGELLLDGKEIGHASVRERYESGISYISDDRQSDSLIPDMNISDNLMLRDYASPPYADGLLIRRGAVKENAKDKMKEFEVRASGTQGAETKVRLLSGGNQQKLIIARELSDRSRLVVAAQPTRGLDIGATEFVRERLVRKKESGGAVLLISADLEEIVAISDRVAVLYDGRIMDILDRNELDIRRIGLLMGGVNKESV